MPALSSTVSPAPAFSERHGAYGIERTTPESPFTVYAWNSGDELDECDTLDEALGYVARYQKGDALFAAALSAEEEGAYACYGAEDQLARGEE